GGMAGGRWGGGGGFGARGDVRSGGVPPSGGQRFSQGGGQRFVQGGGNWQGGNWRGRRHVRNFGPGFAFGFGGPYYYDYATPYYDDTCWQLTAVQTRSGGRYRPIWVCE